MYRKLSCYLLFIYIFANTDVLQLLKTGEFIVHYAQHKMEDSRMTFIDFINIHYFSGGVLDSDYAADMTLPFKKNDLTDYRLTDQFYHVIVHEIKHQVIIFPKEIITYHPTLCLLNFPTDIWQPPRV